MKKTLLRKYARLIAEIGINVKKGQEVVIRAELDQPEFVSYVVTECYKLGAKKVTVEWNYQPLEKVHNRYRSLKTLSKLEDWEIAKLSHRADTLPAMIYLLSEDPDGLVGMDQEKAQKAMQTKYPIIKPYRDKMDSKYQWCIAAVPGKAWAKKIFPELNVSQAVEKLWEAILVCSRVGTELDSDAIKNWNDHNRTLAHRCDYLNSLELRYLEYSASNGTKLCVGLIPDAIFMGGGENALGSGIYFNPNIPTEEIFVTPKKGEADGIVYSSKPLSYEGQLIENFSVRFENGKAVEVHAEKNEELLRRMVQMDEGASYLGECALVPCDSPINNSGLLFYNTLFDENASCHLALGNGFANCIKDFEKYTLEECREKGINDSMIHEDFMIGTTDLNITGITADGKKVPIFKNGNWAFEV
ncbi:MAG: aminopeptidase [Clostridia bacterium]|nr:aminopeptidase [Clostridia bacterium]